MAAFTPGNIVVYRVGTYGNTTALAAAATVVYLDEYTPAGVLVQSIMLPTADAGSTHALTAVGNSTSEGFLTLSADGRYLVLTGYDVGTAQTTALTSARTIGRVAGDGSIDTSTTVSTANAGSGSSTNIRSAASENGSSFYIATASKGVEYVTLGGGTVTQLNGNANDRTVGLFGHQLYVDTSTVIATFGASTPTGGGSEPTAATSTTNLTNVTGSSSYGFFLADLSSSVPGFDTLYVADDAAGLKKFTYDGNSWTLVNTVTLGTNPAIRGLTGYVDAAGVHLVATSASAIYTLTDTAASNVADNGTLTALALKNQDGTTVQITSGVALRGVAFTPSVSTATISISSAAIAQNEGNGGTTNFTYTLTRSSGTADATVVYDITGSGANAATASDFAGGTLPHGTATFTGTSLTTTIVVPVAGDTTYEPDETFTVTLSNPQVGSNTGYVLGTQSSQTGTIVNDDVQAAPTLSINSVSIVEGNGGTSTLTFHVTLSAAAAGDVTFHYATADGSASAGSDYVALPDTTATIAAGSLGTDIAVQIVGDRVIEGDETFTLTLSQPTGATIAGGAGTGTGTIQNDDSAGSFALAGNVSQGEAAGLQSFTVTRSGGDVGAATISYAVTASGAHPADGGDFTGGALPGGTVQFADGQTSQTIVVPVADDATYESDETYTLTLTGTTAGTIGTATAIGTIVNDDAPPPVGAFSLAGNVTQSEAQGSQSFTVQRIGGSAGTASVSYAVVGSDANAADANDFTGAVLPSGTVTFGDGETAKTITIPVANDRAIEADETYTLTLSNPTGGATLGATASATGTIVNDDSAGSFALAGNVTQSEAAGSQTFTVTRSGGDVGAATVSYTVVGSGANPADAADFGGALPTGTIQFADGQVSQTITVPVTNDATYEADETYTLTLTGTTAGTIGTAAATGTIQNDDPVPPTLSIANAQVVEGDGGTTALVFTVTSSFAAPTDGITFQASTADGTATAGSDYAALVGVAGSIAAGQTSTTVTVQVNGDTTFERNETLTVTLSNPTGATIASGQGTATGTIVNDDAVPDGTTAAIFSTDFASFTAAGFAPGGVAGGLDSNVWRVVGLSAQPNPAYGFTGPAGNTGNVNPEDFGRGVIDGSADPTTAGVYSPSGNHALVLQPTGAELDVGGFIEARIQNTSGATATSFDLAFDWAYRNSAERADKLQLAYSTDGVTFTTLADADFTTPQAAPKAADGKTIVVPNAFSAQHEAVTITGTVADGGYLYLRWVHVSSATGGNRDEVGIDNVAVTAHLSSIVTGAVANISVAEGNTGTTAATFTITRSNGAGTASVDYATADGTALAGSDYQAQSGTVTFAAGETSKTVTVLVNGDTAHEADETFSLKLGNAVGFQIPQPSATATIVNDDAGPVAIYDIQGLGHRSPFTGQSVSTYGVVTAVKSNGFYLQDERHAADGSYQSGDGNIGTSDAIFVATTGAPTVAVGNLVSLTGTVTEYAAATNQLSLTELTGISGLTVVETAAPLPDAVVIATDGVAGHRAPPTSVVDDDGFRSYDPTTDGADFYESLEGMRVTIQQPLVVGPTDANGNSFVVASNGVGATGLNDRYGMTISAGDPNPETLKIYEGSGKAGAHSQGDVLNDVTGILTYYGGRYEVDPTAAVTTQLDRPAPTRETTTLTGDADHVSYASFNLENLSPVPDANGNDTQAKIDARFAAHAAEIVNALHSPDVLGLQEVQDNDGDLGTTALSASATIQKLIDAIVAAGGPVYKYVEVPPTANGISGGDPNGNIRDVFLYNPARVSYVDGSVHRLDNPVFAGTRYPLVADFTFNGQTFTAIDQHSTSRGGSDPVFSSNQPPTQAGDASRTAQAQAIRSYIDGVLASDPAHLFVVNGDFNGFPYETALQSLVVNGGLYNLYDKLAVQERYSYYFDGYYQAFDNILISNGLNAASTFDVVHYNAGFTDGLSQTDHDQALAEIGLARSTGAAVAVADSYSTTAAAILHGTVLANDTGGAGTISVAAVDGAAANVGVHERLASGALLTLLADGTFNYDPDGAFSGLAAGATATDHFSYTLANGSTATATITVTGIATPAADANGHINGTSGNDTYGGTAAGDYFDLSAGGVDTVNGGAGADAFFFGAALTGADHVYGGSGMDQVGIQGDYTGANRLVLNPASFSNVEVLAALPGYSYDIKLDPSVIGDAGKFTVFGTTLGAADKLTVDGSSVSGPLTMYGGLGTDTLTGGSGDDGFYFGPDRWGAGDVVHGGGGANDQLALDGNYTITVDARMDVEVLALLSGPAGNPDSYALTVADGWVGAGQTKTITAVTSFGGSAGPVATNLVIDAAAETDGSLRIIGGYGNDALTGGGGADTIYGNDGDDTITGGLGADRLSGGAGHDVFVYTGAAQSTGTGYDTLLDFDYAEDRIRIVGETHDSYATVTGGRLDDATFDADLQAAVGGQLVNGAAVFFTASSGSHAGETFLVVDANGAAGYQAGGDYVFHLGSASPATVPDFLIA